MKKNSDYKRKKAVIFRGNPEPEGEQSMETDAPGNILSR